jgi:acyl-CoA thioester hydrolase
MPLKTYPIVFEQNVAWGDMDAFGHLNNVIYYRYMESARIAYMQAVQLLEQNFNLVVASSNCKYFAPVVFPDQLSIGARIEELRNSAFRMHYLIWSTSQQKTVAEGEAVLVCVDKITMQKQSIPLNIRQFILDLESSVNHII